jgi:hypothetical protein
LFSSCNFGNGLECTVYPDLYYNIPEAELALIPFNAKDTLIYVSNQKDTAVLVGKGSNGNYTWKHDQEGIYPDCPGKDFYYEYINYYYQSSNAQFKTLTLTLSIPVLTYYPKNPPSSTFNVEINYSKIISGLGLMWISDEKRYLDSVVINGVSYKGYNLKGYPDSSRTVLYNAKYGALRIQWAPDQVWLKQ